MTTIVVGFFLFATDLVVYGLKLARYGKRITDHWPSGHPWSGLTIALLGIKCVAYNTTPAPLWLDTIAIACALCWLFTCVMELKQPHTKPQA